MDNKDIISKIQTTYTKNFFLYDTYIRDYEDGLGLNWRLLHDFKKKFPNRKGYNHISKYDITRNVWRTYDGFMSKLNLDEVIPSTYGKVSQSIINALKQYTGYFVNFSENKKNFGDIYSEGYLCGVSYGHLVNKKFDNSIVSAVRNNKGKIVKKKQKQMDIEPVVLYQSVFDTIIDISGADRYIGGIKRLKLYDIKLLYSDEVYEKAKKVQEGASLIGSNFNRVKQVNIGTSYCQTLLTLGKWGDYYEVFKSTGNELVEMIDWYEKNEDGEIEHYILANGEVVYNDIFESPLNEFPIVPYYFERVPGTANPIGISYLCKNGQTEVDNIYSGYKLGLKTIAYPDWTSTTNIANASNNIEHIGLGVKPATQMSTLDTIPYYNSNNLAFVLQECQRIESHTLNNLLVYNINAGQDGKQIRVAEDARQRATAKENKIAKAIDNMGLFLTSIMKQTLAWKQLDGGIVNIKLKSGKEKEIRISDINMEFELTFDGEQILNIKQGLISDLMNKIGLLSQFNINETTGEKYIDSETVINTMSELMGIGGELVLNNEDRLKKYEADLKYMEKKQSLTPANPPVDNIDKINMSISVNANELTPESIAILELAKPGFSQQIAAMQQPVQQVQEQSTQQPEIDSFTQSLLTQPDGGLQ